MRSERQRALLAVLVLSAGRRVDADWLVEVAWPAALPQDPRAALQSQVMRLRRSLGPAGEHVRTDGAGYVLDVDRDTCDVHRFRALVRSAATAQQPADVLRDALALWRGAALADVRSDALAPAATALEEERLAAVERRLGLDLADGRHAAAVAELRELTAQHPLREQLWAQLMTGLWASGRQSEALAAYREVRSRLRDELGIEPGGELRRVHAAVLDGSLVVAPSAAPVAKAWNVHQQLPLDVAHLVGRDSSTRAVESVLNGGDKVPVVVISGLAGVGKTAVAVRVGHRLKDAFPDGQWFVRLGAGSGRPRPAEQVLERMLSVAGMDPSTVPDDVEAQAALLRTRLANRRVLILLDDAASADQVEPLLPGAAGCAAIVTSRVQLGELTALHHAHPVPLEALSPDESVTLLSESVGERIASDPVAAGEIAARCEHLPLALRIAAATLALQPSLDVARYAERLHGDRLSALTVPGTELALREAFDVFAASLSAEVHRAFVHLGLAVAHELSLDAVAGVLELATDEASRISDALCAANVLVRTATGRFRMHDLLRDYAASVADETAAAHVRTKLAEWYLQAVVDALAATEFSSVAALPGPEPDPNRFGDVAVARQWLDAELGNFVAMVEQTAAQGPVEYAWRLADALRPYLWNARQIAAWRVIVAAGLEAATEANEPIAAGAMAHSNALLAFAVGQQAEESVRWYQRALDAYERGGYALGAAVTLTNIGAVLAGMGNPHSALDVQARSIEAYRAAGASELAGIAMANRCDTLLQLGDLSAAIRDATEVLEMQNARGHDVALINRAVAYVQLGNYEAAKSDAATAIDHLAAREQLAGMTSAQLELARANLGEGACDAATEIAERVLQSARQTSDTVRIAEALDLLAVVCRVTGRPAQALQRAEEALAWADAGAEEVRPRALLALAAARYELGELPRASETAQEALRLTEGAGLRIQQARAHGVLAAVSAALGDALAATRHGAAADELCAQTRFRFGWYEVRPPAVT